jgi:CspA family cold shock protein
MKSTYEKPSERKKRLTEENIKRVKKLQKVKWFNSKKGYGFITEDETEKDIFLHVSALEESKLKTLKEEQLLEFDVKEENNKLQAINLKKV